MPDRLRASVTKDRAIAELVVVAPQKMEEKMTFVNADEMSKAITESGKVALYGIYFDNDKDVFAPRFSTHTKGDCQTPECKSQAENTGCRARDNRKESPTTISIYLRAGCSAASATGSSATGSAATGSATTSGAASCCSCGTSTGACGASAASGAGGRPRRRPRPRSPRRSRPAVAPRLPSGLDLQRLRFLGDVRVLGPGVDLELRDLLED